MKEALARRHPTGLTTTKTPKRSKGSSGVPVLPHSATQANSEIYSAVAFSFYRPGVLAVSVQELALEAENGGVFCTTLVRLLAPVRSAPRSLALIKHEGAGTY